MNSLRTLVLAGLGLGLAAVTPAAAATSAVVTAATSERAGPSLYYPVVSDIPGGAAVTMYGCLTGASWCDVSYAGARGWVPGTYLQAYYQARPVAVPYYVAVIGIPIIAFDFDVYWNDYYRGRPFFHDRDRYRNYAHGPGAKVAAVAGPHGKGGRFAGRPGQPQNLAAAGPKNHRHPGQPQTLAAAGPKHPHAGQNFAAVGPKHPPIKAGRQLHPMVAHAGNHPRTMIAHGRGNATQFAHAASPKFAMAPHGGPKACRGKGACS